ncbi:MAG: ubiquinol-cytochrome c reductase iron-sulfur subunit N-terminal domain-containing protein, partial [Methylotenera sp.]
MSDNQNDKQQADSQGGCCAPVDLEKRNFLIATSAVGAIGCAAVAVPFVASMTPSERAKAAGAPVEVDISKIEPGTMLTAEWRGQ